MQLLDDRDVEIDAVEERTLRTALHCAAMNDQLEVCRTLIELGACINKPNREGRMAVHHRMDGKDYYCLSLFLRRDLNTTVYNTQNLTVWHRAAQIYNVEALKDLVSHSKSEVSLEGLERSRAPSLIPYAAQRGLEEVEKPISLLLVIGCTFSMADGDGCTALHPAARTGLPDVVRLLISRSSNASVLMDDGSNAINYAMAGCNTKLEEVLDVLLQEGVSPFKGRKDGTIPVQLLVKDRADSGNGSVKEKAL